MDIQSFFKIVETGPERSHENLYTLWKVNRKRNRTTYSSYPYQSIEKIGLYSRGHNLQSETESHPVYKYSCDGNSYRTNHSGIL